MYYYLARCIKNAVTTDIKLGYDARILSRLICAELEATTHPALLPFDSEAMQNYLLAWIESEIIYHKEYSLVDIYRVSIKENFDDIIREYFPFYAGDPALKSILQEDGRHVFVKVFSKCKEFFGVDDQLSDNPKTVMRLMFTEEKNMTEDCLVEYFKNNFRSSKKTDDNRYLYNVAIGNQKVSVYLSSSNLRDIVEACIEAIDELKRIYNSGYRYSDFEKLLRDYEIDITFGNNSRNDKIDKFWYDDHFSSDNLNVLVDRIANILGVSTSDIQQKIVQLKTAVIRTYNTLVEEFEQYEFDATLKCIYLLALSIMQIFADRE